MSENKLELFRRKVASGEFVEKLIDIDAVQTVKLFELVGKSSVNFHLGRLLVLNMNKQRQFDYLQCLLTINKDLMSEVVDQNVNDVREWMRILKQHLQKVQLDTPHVFLQML